ncbi:16S rRNA (uracil(1498)-N(3))-methyltransferase [Pseudidiomarina donghaiensis]|uniref:Ribosomal RNA small subunit methyltransferase E n=1 Tax=Pseudidiomarina donghaiensis TaxID=519452 RepID=A0A432XFQ4_9GAMM|nr:16S rRNA (uracil(1498)-N(3))-methyltransferase [Pseudidiomarina donghaiensis]RUO47436.1 16S rRNA (uracil(1498)-N(3))-methyltransferase [Pseudidiomarina donghaiensis]SFV23023.1 16S rRNA (uracil1498-N3)-methyltransferase [Pseudidiomarina donghaiensis]
MRVPRIYEAAGQPWQIGANIHLSEDAANHVGRVLRMTAGQQLELFNGDGNNYAATIVEATKRSVTVTIEHVATNQSEAPLAIHLAQGISRGERMDFVLQKSVELGVTEITPLFTERCGVKLTGERLLKKQQQWQKIVIAACEQSGRSVVPQVHTPMHLQQWLTAGAPSGLKLTLDPYAAKPLRDLADSPQQVTLFIGPEGGLTETEVQATASHEFLPVRLGPRILRTETAALTALSVIQYQFGDLA